MPSKRSRRERKRLKQRRVPPKHLLAQARQSLAVGDGRKALDLLRQAQHGDPALEELPLLLFCACVQRARQLAEKGLAKEAAAMRASAMQHRASIAFQQLAEENLVQYIRHADGAEALADYADYLQAQRSAHAPSRTNAGGPARDPTVLAGPRSPRAGPPSAARRRAGRTKSRSHGRRGLGTGRRPARRNQPAVPVCPVASVLQGHGVFRPRR